MRLAHSLLAALVLAAGCAGQDGETFDPPAAEDPGPIHVHGLGINPEDDSLFIATHTGLYRVGKDERKAERVADRYQDTMGFTVVGRSRFLGSGHPDLREAREKDLPPLLGLIESQDAGETWEPISLLGEADFHVLRFVGDRVYGFDATNNRLMISADAGKTWTERRPPGSLVDLAVDPNDAKHITATSLGGVAEGFFASSDGGERWEAVSGLVGLLAWPAPKRLFLVAPGGLIFFSDDAGEGWDRVGEVGGEPAAFLAQSEEELYVALHDGTIKRSTDGGASWSVRSAP